MALLEIRDLSLAIAGTPILRGLSLDLDAGQTLGLVGESGSGKSLTALSVLQLLPRGSVVGGKILLDGRDVTGMAESLLCRLRGNAMAMVFQEPMTALNPVHTAGAQVAEGIRLHTGASRAVAEDRVRAIFGRVGLGADTRIYERYPHQLSGGQRQRVVIAMAVALDPMLLIADEPTSALDVTVQAQILDLLRDLVSEKKTALLLISHDLAVVADMADRIAIMKDGEIVEQDRTRELFRSMSHPYSKALVAASAHVPARPDMKDAGVAQENLVDVRHVERAYPMPRRYLWRPASPFRAVDDVSFEIAPGQSVGLVGESGCGKSTLARMMLGLDRPTGGQILFRGEDIATLDRKKMNQARRHMQVVFQDPFGSFNPRHRVGRLVAEPLHLLRGTVPPAERGARVAEVLRDVGLDPSDAEKFPHEFSGGQRQRLAVARALITRPALVVADEPVSALDVSVRAQILDLLAELRSQFGLAYLFISHDLSVVRAITDDVLVMYQGRIVERGRTGEVFDSPNHPYTRKLVDAAPDLDRTLAGFGVSAQSEP